MGLVINATPRSLCFRKETRHPLCGKLGGPQSWAGRMPKIHPTPAGIRSPDLQPVASRYTDYSTPVHLIRCYAAPTVDVVRVVIAATSPEALLIRIVPTRTTIWLSRIGVLFSTHSGSFTESCRGRALSPLSLSQYVDSCVL